MSGYLLFDKTGVYCIDKILEELQNAGNAYHDTEWWNDNGTDDGPTYVERIQNAANEAAFQFNLDIAERAIAKMPSPLEIKK